MCTAIRTWKKCVWIAGVTLLVGWQGSMAATYYIDPAVGLISNNGSSANPWNTLQAVATAKTFAAGDTIYLRSGYHGAVSISGSFAAPVVFVAQPGQKPMLKSLSINNARHLVFQGLTITPDATTPYAKVTLVSFGGSATQCNVQACTLYSKWDVAAWDSAAWNTLPCNAVSVSGTKDTVRGNYIKNIDFGISVGYDAESTLVERNRIEYFNGDGLRGLGNYGVFQYNFVGGCVATNTNHDDGFQSWSYGTAVGNDTVHGVVVRGNTIIDYLPSLPFPGTLQGIGNFDGFFKGWVVENNVICTDHWHGISLYGAINCRIINNTVCDPNTASPGPPWIGIFAHKNGTASTGCVVRNNLSTAYTYGGATNDHNRTLNNSVAGYGLYFVNYAALDFRLKPTAVLAIDSGSATLAPALDLAGTPRPYGNGVDLGAYEYVPVGISDAALRARNHLAPALVTIAPLPVAHEGVVRCLVPMQCRIYRPDGAMVAKFNVPQAGEYAWKTAGLENGVYLLEAVGNGATYTMKIVVRR
jgi:hypothetical protein